MPQFYQTLLGHIINTRLMPLDKKVIELEATAVQEVQTDIQRAEQALQRGMREDIRPFQNALQAAYRNHQAGQASIDLRQNVPDENDMADALIQYLVKPDLADVVTDELGPGNYVYHVEVHWQELEQLAREVGYDLNSNLTRPINQR